MGMPTDVLPSQCAEIGASVSGTTAGRRLSAGIGVIHSAPILRQMLRMVIEAPPGPEFHLLRQFRVGDCDFSNRRGTVATRVVELEGFVFWLIGVRRASVDFRGIDSLDCRSLRTEQMPGHAS
jgi:hypothetical protein